VFATGRRVLPMQEEGTSVYLASAGHKLDLCLWKSVGLLAHPTPGCLFPPSCHAC
jgi:hypothetical protein